MTRLWIALVAPTGLLVGTSAAAQELDNDLIVQPAIPQDLNRGRNVSVGEQARPEYSALGVPLGGVTVYPSVNLGAGATSNTYLAPGDGNASPFVYQEGAIRLRSNWSRHSLTVSASALERQYLGESERNEHLWSANAAGRLDVYHSMKVEGAVSASRNFENLFSGEVTPTVAALSQYRRDLASIKATYAQGRGRTFLLFDHADYRFSPVSLRTGGELDQSARDRKISRLTGQVEYARSPSVAFFAQVSGMRIKYPNPISLARANQDSDSLRVLGGVNVDIAGQVRGTVGLGYSMRNYDAAIYRTVSGLSAEVQLEAFPTPRLTVGFNGRRSIEDTASGFLRPSFSTRMSLRADYELLRNFIISGTGSYRHQARSGDTYRGAASGRFLFSRRVSVESTVSYSRRSFDAVSEARADASISYHL